MLARTRQRKIYAKMLRHYQLMSLILLASIAESEKCLYFLKDEKYAFELEILASKLNSHSKENKVTAFGEEFEGFVKQDSTSDTSQFQSLAVVKPDRL